MGLCGIGEADEMAAQRGLAFLLRSRLGDGSWPIDSNLDTRVSTLAMNSVVLGGERVSVEQLQDWLLDQQFGETHPGTNAAPGGWSWTHLPGGVPDAKDTADALLLLKAIEPYLIVTRTARRFLSVKPGVRWLLGLQNNDGGVSTFVKGRSKLAIDGSSPDVTAHGVSATQGLRSQNDVNSECAALPDNSIQKERSALRDLVIFNKEFLKFINE